MRSNLAIANLLLVVGVAYVLFLTQRSRGVDKSACWFPWTALAVLSAGPIMGIVFWTIEAYVANPILFSLTYVYAPIICFLVVAVSGTAIHHQFTILGRGPIHRVIISFFAAMIVFATIVGSNNLYGHPKINPVAATLIPLVLILLISEKAAHYSWIKSKVKLRYQIAICCILGFAAKFIYQKLSQDFIPTDAHIPQQFLDAKVTCKRLAWLLIPTSVLLIPSRYFLSYVLVGLFFYIPGYELNVLPHHSLFAYSSGFLRLVAEFVSPFALVGAALEFLPHPQLSKVDA